MNLRNLRARLERLMKRPPRDVTPDWDALVDGRLPEFFASVGSPCPPNPYERDPNYRDPIQAEIDAVASQPKGAK